MSENGNELQRAVADLIGEMPAPGAHLSADELAAYHAGELAAGEKARCADHLVACAECTSLLLDLERLTMGELSAGPVSEFERAAAWRDLRPRLENAAAPRRRSSSSPSTRWKVAMAASLVAVVGLSFWVLTLRRTVGELTRPQLNAAVQDLYSGVERSVAGEVTELRLAPGERLFTVVLHTPRETDQDAYDVEISDAGGETVWSGGGLRRNEFGSLSLALTRQLLAAGDYRIRLYVRGSPRDGPVAEFALRIVESAAEE